MKYSHGTLQTCTPIVNNLEVWRWKALKNILLDIFFIGMRTSLSNISAFDAIQNILEATESNAKKLVKIRHLFTYSHTNQISNKFICPHTDWRTALEIIKPLWTIKQILKIFGILWRETGLENHIMFFRWLSSGIMSIQDKHIHIQTIQIFPKKAAFYGKGESCTLTGNNYNSHQCWRTGICKHSTLSCPAPMMNVQMALFFQWYPKSAGIAWPGHWL